VNGHKKNPQEMARNYKNWLKAYMEYTRDSESPSTFHFWTGVSVIAGALRRRVWVDMKKFEWTPNFYIILVGPPGVAAKTTSIGMGMRLLAQIPGIKWGPESMTWQKLTRSLADSIEYLEFVNFQGQKERIAMSCNTIEVGELGTFLKTDDDALVSFLIRMWEGQRGKFRHETITGGAVEIDNPWLNIIAATTPAWMRDNFSESMIGGGLTSRVLFVYGDKKRSLSRLTPMRSFLMQNTSCFRAILFRTWQRSPDYLVRIDFRSLRESGDALGTQTTTTPTSDLIILPLLDSEVIFPANRPTFTSSQLFWRLQSETRSLLKKRTSAKPIKSSPPPSTT
jgi:hypothetical protein